MRGKNGSNGKGEHPMDRAIREMAAKIDGMVDEINAEQRGIIARVAGYEGSTTPKGEASAGTQLLRVGPCTNAYSGKPGVAIRAGDTCIEMPTVTAEQLGARLIREANIADSYVRALGLLLEERGVKDGSDVSDAVLAEAIRKAHAYTCDCAEREVEKFLVFTVTGGHDPGEQKHEKERGR